MTLTEKDKSMLATYFEFGEGLQEEINKMGETPDSLGIELHPIDRLERRTFFNPESQFRFPTTVICGLCSKPTKGAIILYKGELRLNDAEGFFLAADHCVCDSCMAEFGKAIRRKDEKTKDQL